MGSGTINGGNNNGRYLYVKWSSTANTSANSSNVSATLYLSGNVQGNALSGSFFNLNGTQKTVSGWYDNWGTGNPLNLGTINITVGHNNDGSKSIPVSGKFVYNGSFTYVDLSATITLDKINRLPGNPSNINISGLYEDGETQTLTWSAATNATNYGIYHSVWQLPNGGWSQWYGPEIVSGTSKTFGHGEIGKSKRGAIKYGVQANAPGGSSGIFESAVTEHYGIRVWSGNSWKWAQLRVWNGSAWIKSIPQVWNSSGWEQT